LAEPPGAAYSKASLLAGVWGEDADPETNTVAVHVYRLRRKLARQGAGHIRIGLTPDGCYALCGPEEPDSPSPRRHRGQVVAGTSG
jgi:DNA-binding response OmpR family regulator